MTQEEMNQKEEEKEQKKQENDRNAANNARALRVAANVAQKSGNPYAAAAGTIVKAADTITGGKSSELVGRAINQANKITPGGKMVQKGLNKTMESGAGDVAGAIASKKLDAKNTAQTAEEAKKAAEAAEKTKKAKEAAEKAQSVAETVDNAAGGEEKSNGGLVVVLIIAAILLVSIGSTLIIPIIIVAPLSTILPTDSVKNLNKLTITNTYNNMYDGEITLEKYIAGLLAAEEHPIEDLDYYKFLALEARTIYFSNSSSNNNVVNLNGKKNKYIPVDGTPHEETIQRAVDETRGHFIYTDQEINENTIKATVTKNDDNYYYIEYKSSFMDVKKEQQISKKWKYISEYKSKLDSSSSTNNDIVNILSIYLITEKNYTYENLINEYYKNAEVANFNLGVTGIEVNGYISPIASYTCSSSFGCRNNPIDNKYSFHNGIDLAAKEGENVYATKAGTIAKVISNIPGYSNTIGEGNSIIINHDDGSQTRYYHLLYGSMPSKISVGARVEQGEKIAEVGSTGKSTAPHLHYEILINGNYVNPYYYMDLTWASGGELKCNNNEITPPKLCQE